HWSMPRPMTFGAPAARKKRARNPWTLHRTTFNTLSSFISLLLCLVGSSTASSTWSGAGGRSVPEGGGLRCSGVQVFRCSVDARELVGVGDGVDAAHLLAVRGQVEDDDGEGRVAREQQGRGVAVDLPVADAQTLETQGRAGDPEGQQPGDPITAIDGSQARGRGLAPAVGP